MHIDITIIDKRFINKRKQLHQFTKPHFSIKKERPPLPKATFPQMLCPKWVPLMMGSGGLIVMDEDNCMVDILIITWIEFLGNYQIVISLYSYGYSQKGRPQFVTSPTILSGAIWWLKPFLRIELAVIYLLSASSIAFAAVLPAPIAEITVAAPVTASPPA